MAQLGFFDTERRVLVDDASGRIEYVRDALSPDDAARAFAELESTIPWRSERRMMYEREVDVPRLVASVRIAEAMPPALERLLAAVRAHSAAPYNSIGFNLYRDGRDSVAPHNDTLHELETGEPIALVSLGATRRMTIRSKGLPRRIFDLDLEPGSLLLMSYPTQLTYDHAIPKTAQAVGPRISAAFRVRAANGYRDDMSTDNTPLTPKEAEAMGRQTERETRGERIIEQTVYGDVGGTVENEDQTDAHHAEPDEHV